jgi:hypothetical protein
VDHALSFEEIASVIAKIMIEEGEVPAETAARRFQIAGWCRHKLFKRAQEIVAQRGLI